MFGKTNITNGSSCIKVLKYTSVPTDAKKNNSVAVVTSIDIPNSIYSLTSPADNVSIGTVWIIGGNLGRYGIQLGKKDLFLNICGAAQWDGSKWVNVTCYIRLNDTWNQARMDLVKNGIPQNGFNLSNYSSGDANVSPIQSSDYTEIHGNDASMGSTIPIYALSGRTVYIEISTANSINETYFTYSSSYLKLESNNISSISDNKLLSSDQISRTTFTQVLPSSRYYYFNVGRPGAANTKYIYLYNLYIL